MEKLVRKCFLQYSHEREALPLTEKQLETMLAKIEKAREETPDVSLNDIVNDVVYDFLTD